MPNNDAINVVSKRCPKCGEGVTPEGHDPCITNLPGVTNACCGHGSSEGGYIQFSDGRIIRGCFTVEKPSDKKSGVERISVEEVHDETPPPFRFWE